MPPIQPEAEYEVPWPRRARVRPTQSGPQARQHEAGEQQPRLPCEEPGYERPCPEVHERERHGDRVEHDVSAELDEAHLAVVETPLDARLCRRPHHIHRDREDEHAKHVESPFGMDEGSRSERQAEARTGDGQGRNEKVCERHLVELVGRFGLLSDEEDLRSPLGEHRPEGDKDRRAAVDAVRAWSEHTNDDRDAAEADQPSYPLAGCQVRSAAHRQMT